MATQSAAPRLSALSTNTEPDEIWTVEQVAAYLKIKPSAVYLMTRERGQTRCRIPLPCFKIHSKALRFRKSQVIDWVKQLAARA
jgi:predicted DNA-binding transcriptional regulator AlpA